MDAAIKLVEGYYWLIGLLGLVGVYGLLFAHGAAGRRRVLNEALRQWGVVFVLAVSTPFILWMLKG